MIVKAVPSDAETLTQIALESKAYWGYSSAQLESWRSDLTILPETFNDWSGCKFTIDTEIVGFYLLNKGSSKIWVLEFLFVKPPFIGKNIGGQLIEHAIKSCRTNSCKVLSVLSDSNAVAFYEKYGFKTISLKESSVPGRFLPEMELKIPENE